MKQTAVQWLRDLYENQPAYEEHILDEQWEKALEMEKKQIVKFSKVVLKEYKWIRPEELSTIKRLYNETFNTNEK
jgi:hypothetical protein